ncbi:unnamed protein product, partial [Symbiodinium sp. CCMP2456]
AQGLKTQGSQVSVGPAVPTPLRQSRVVRVLALAHSVMADVPIDCPSDEDTRRGSPKAPRLSDDRRRDPSGAITFADLQLLLSQQSESLAKTQAKEIRGAIAELREATTAELKGIKAEVVRHSDYISQLRDQHDRMEARIMALEHQKSDASTAYLGSATGEAHQKNLVILGGWDADTHKADLLPELKDMLGRIGVLEKFQDIFTTGPRRGHAMGLVKWPPGANEQELKRHLIQLVQEIRFSSMASKSMAIGKTLWAALSKTKMERLRSGHAGKTKRLILEVNASEKHAMDVEWGAGSVWMRSKLVASATRTPPRDASTVPGRAPGMWIDVLQISRMLGASCETLTERWEALISECPPEGEKAEEGSVNFFSWNIGGKPIESALAATEHSAAICAEKAIFALQELPRSKVGWQTCHYEQRTLVQYRGDTQWRGNGIMFPTAEYTCLRRKANEQGIWVRLRRLSTGMEFWLCSARLSTGVSDAETAEEAHQLLRLRPPTSLPSLVLADFNTPVIVIAEGSFRQIGGDHDRLEISVDLGKRPQLPHQSDTRPRVVVGEIPPQVGFSQATAEKLAREYTQPKKGARYRDPPEVRAAFKRAKLADTEQAWKHAQSARRGARDEWLNAKIQRASQGSWKDMKDLKDRTGAEWAVHLTEEAYAQHRDPLLWTTEHFAKVFRAATEECKPVAWKRTEMHGRAFDTQELRSVVTKGQRGKAVGLDLTSYELVKELCKDPVTEGSLLAWMESVRLGAPVPKAWLTTIVTLLPKKTKPESPADLRPISLSSAMGKIFGGLVLQRTRAALRPKGPEQCALGGRQTADYLFSVIRTFSLETEWRFGLMWLKLDIHKAYDSINRSKVLEYLSEHLPDEMWHEFEAWKQLLNPGVAWIRTPWGTQAVDQTRGIRQGSVESPFIFAVAMECALHTAQSHPTWPGPLSSAPDLQLTSLLFMDDSILWETRREALEQKFQVLSKELREWGLMVNPKKTSFYCSPYATSCSQICLDGTWIRGCRTLEVMGVKLRVPFKPAAVMDTGLAKARKKYFASRGLLECRGPLKKRLQVFQSCVGGAALWYAAAAPPNIQAMGALNSMQLEMVARMSGIRRKPAEGWLDFRLRGLRAARQILANVGAERWSTQWLRRHWQYRGHVARSAEREEPPASAIIDGFRTLPWWRAQQARRDGARHPAAFYPHMSNEEIRLNRAAGVAHWRSLAMLPADWKKREPVWIQQNDIAWCTGRQLALAN